MQQLVGKKKLVYLELFSHTLLLHRFHGCALIARQIN